MTHRPSGIAASQRVTLSLRVIGVIIIMLMCPFNIFSANPQKPIRPVRRTPPPTDLPDSIPLSSPVKTPAEVVTDSLSLAPEGNVEITPVDSFAIINGPSMTKVADAYGMEMPQVRIFNPDPIRAVWMSALFPGLGQAYNRRFWKLPIIVAGFMGLGYGTSWNNGMLRDYTRAYSDIMDNDPNTKSYMDFFPSTIKEEDLDRSWLTNILKSRKDYYRRNRDLCIISMVGVYLLAMVDAYVDASLAHFDISSDLSMHVAPAVIPDTRNKPGIGLQWAFTF